MGHIVFIGPPGSGKGTQCSLLADRWGKLHLSTGEMLRALIASGTALSRWIAARLDFGNFAPDHLVLQLIRERLEECDTRRGCLFDGFPRTCAQAVAFDRVLTGASLPLEAAVYLHAADEVLHDRLARRATVEGRPDDDLSAVSQRMRVFDRVTAPVIEYYRGSGRLVTVDASGSTDEVTLAIEQALACFRSAGKNRLVESRQA